MAVYADPVAERLNTTLTKGLGAWVGEQRGAHGEWAKTLADKIDKEVPGERQNFRTGGFAQHEASKYHARQASAALREGRIHDAGTHLAAAKEAAAKYTASLSGADKRDLGKDAKHREHALEDALDTWNANHTRTPDFHRTEELEHETAGHAQTPETITIETQRAGQRAYEHRHDTSIAPMA